MQRTEKVRSSTARVSRVRSSERQGFTLIELLVVIGIIGVLVSLLLPAVQMARMAAYRVEGENNLRQLLLAAQNMQTSTGHFPPGAVTKKFAGSPVNGIPEDGSVKHGWGVFLLPYLEQSALANQYRWDLSYDHPTNQSVVSQPLKVFSAPATPGGLRRGEVRQGLWLAASDFHPPQGVSDLLTTPHADWGNQSIVPGGSYGGVIEPNKVTRPAEITDGLSNTVMFIESAGGPTLWRLGREISQGVATGFSAYDPASPFLVHGTCDFGGHFPGPQWSVTNLGGEDGEAHGFHPGVILAGFSDGGVRKISKELDIRIYVALIGKADGRVAEDY